jgi:hypothetical protein
MDKLRSRTLSMVPGVRRDDVLGARLSVLDAAYHPGCAVHRNQLELMPATAYSGIISTDCWDLL